jgi:hypothetical protein
MSENKGNDGKREQKSTVAKDQKTVLNHLRKRDTAVSFDKPIPPAKPQKK